MIRLFKSKVDYQYQLNHSHTIMAKEITDTNELINYVIGVNNNLIDQNKKGWLQIKKMAIYKKKETILYGLRLDLPLMEDNPYFEELLRVFDTKKPIPFEETMFNDDSENQSGVDDKEEVDDNSMPEPLKHLARTGQKQLNQMESTTPTTDTTVESDLVANLQQQLAEATYLLETKDNEINQLKSFVESNRQSEPGLHLSVISESDVVVTDVSQLIDAELQQLKEEVETQDKRKFIAEAVVERINNEKQQAIQAATNLLEEKRQTSLSEAKKNYDDRVQEIETAFLIEKSEKENELKQQYDEKCQNEITSEYTKQTAILEAFIQTRKEKLIAIQQEISQKIEQSVGSLINDP
ncbi:hypothetical protein [uncultured Vagococcus sp.]|uniref:hypothetical protein n=1 Tax=uncultured Vagococcus sp. TaxID=189676 RepID=UPI002583C8A4|nr:hypothetical protein [uncultured Vagococcus sp.]